VGGALLKEKPGMNRLIKYLHCAALILVCLPGITYAWSGEVQGSASSKGKTRAEARDSARRNCQRNAVKGYVSSRVPPGIMEERAQELEKIIKDSERWVVSWEELGEKEEGDRLLLTLRVELAEKKLESALKAAGIFPSRPLPRVFVVVTGTMGEEEIKSAWDKAPG